MFRVFFVLLVMTCFYFVLDAVFFCLLEIFEFNDLYDSVIASTVYVIVQTAMSVVFHGALVMVVYTLSTKKA